MLKIEEILNIEKCAKEDYRNKIINKFEEEYPIIVEFLTQTITNAAKNRKSSINIPGYMFTNKEEIVEYLTLKGFGCWEGRFNLDEKIISGISIYWG